MSRYHGMEKENLPEEKQALAIINGGEEFATISLDTFKERWLERFRQLDTTGTRASQWVDEVALSFRTRTQIIDGGVVVAIVPAMYMRIPTERNIVHRASLSHQAMIAQKQADGLPRVGEATLANAMENQYQRLSKSPAMVEAKRRYGEEWTALWTALGLPQPEFAVKAATVDAVSGQPNRERDDGEFEDL